MKRIVSCLLFASAFTCLAVLPSHAKDAAAGDEQAITQIEKDWGAALVKSDIAAIERFEAAEYMFTDPEGGLSTREESSAELKSGAVKIASFTINDLKVRVFGDTAIAYGLETETSTYKGKDTSGQYRYTDVFVKRNGSWKAVATQATRVAKH